MPTANNVAMPQENKMENMDVNNAGYKIRFKKDNTVV